MPLYLYGIVSISRSLADYLCKRYFCTKRSYKFHHRRRRSVYEPGNIINYAPFPLSKNNNLTIINSLMKGTKVNARRPTHRPYNWKCFDIFTLFLVDTRSKFILRQHQVTLQFNYYTKTYIWYIQLTNLAIWQNFVSGDWNGRKWKGKHEKSRNWCIILSSDKKKTQQVLPPALSGSHFINVL